MNSNALSNVKLRHLRFLLQLAQVGNLGRVAAAMHMTQPAASRLLAELEHSFGHALFERARSGLKPLPEATEVLRFAKLVGAEEQIVADSLLGKKKVTVRMGTIPTAPAVVIQGIRHFKATYPDAMVRVELDTLHQLLPQLLDGSMDLVVARFDAHLITPRLTYERLLNEHLSVVAASHHPLVQKRRLTARELRQWPWVAPQKASSLYPHFAGLFMGEAPPMDIIECTSPMAVHAFLQDGRTLSLWNESVTHTFADAGICVLPVEFQSNPAALGIYSVCDRQSTDETLAMMDALRQMAAPHP